MRLFSDHGPSNPRPGALSRHNFLSFHAVTESPDGSLSYAPGHERIPANFHRSATPYTMAQLSADMAAIFAAHPDQVAVGCNTGTVDTFTPVNFGNLTGGVMNSAYLAQGNNAVCFFFQSLEFFLPDFVRNRGVIANVVGAVLEVVGTIAPQVKVLGCPLQGVQGLRSDMFDQFPGWTMAR